MYLTKDGYLVYNHNAYIDETCNVNGDISLEDVKKLHPEIKKRFEADEIIQEVFLKNGKYVIKMNKHYYTNKMNLLYVLYM